MDVEIDADGMASADMVVTNVDQSIDSYTQVHQTRLSEMWLDDQFGIQREQSIIVIKSPEPTAYVRKRLDPRRIYLAFGDNIGESTANTLHDKLVRALMAGLVAASKRRAWQNAA